MKIAALIARILLGLMFFVFGLNGFLHFIPMQPMPGLGGQFMTAMVASHFAVFVFATQLISGILLLSGQFIPLGLTLLGPLIANILVFHITMAPSGLPIALVVLVLWTIVFAQHRSAFAGVLAQKA